MSRGTEVLWALLSAGEGWRSMQAVQTGGKEHLLGAGWESPFPPGHPALLLFLVIFCIRKNTNTNFSTSSKTQVESQTLSWQNL